MHFKCSELLLNCPQSFCGIQLINQHFSKTKSGWLLRIKYAMVSTKSTLSFDNFFVSTYIELSGRKASLSDRFNSFGLRTIAFSQFYISFFTSFSLSRNTLAFMWRTDNIEMSKRTQQGQSLENIIVGAFTLKNLLTKFRWLLQNR